MPEATTRIPTIAESIRYLWRVAVLMRPYWRRIAKGTALGLLLGLVGLVTPYISKLYFDRVLPSHDVSLLEVLVVGTFVLTITSTILGGIRSYYGATVGAQLGRAMGLMFFNHLQHLTVRFFDEHRVGEITSRFGDLRSSLGAVSGIFQMVIMNVTFLVLVPPLLLVMNPRLALLSLLTVPFTTAVSTVSSRWLRKLSKQSLEVSAELSAFQVETLSHIRTLKAMAAEHFVYRSASEQLHRTMELQLKTSLFGMGIGFINTVVRGIGQGIFSYVAWSAIIHREMTLGDLMAFNAYIAYLAGPVGQFASLFVSFQTTAVSFGRMFEYLDAPVEQNPLLAYEPAPPIAQRLTGDITLSGVHFGYSSDREVLRDVSMHIARGSLTAIVGPSGVGKSSLLRLLSGMEHPHRGDIWFGDARIGDISLPDLRRQIAVVWQETSLWRGTVWENLTYGLDEVPRAHVDAAIRVCRLGETIASLPNGLETTIAEWGATLSGGQRQRLAIARALIRDTPILLLDEATSNVDVHTESEILQDVFSRRGERTVIYVTHRVATASLAERIIVLQDGLVAAEGSHRELLEHSDLYQRMYRAAMAIPDDAPRLRVVGMESAPALR